MQEDSTELEVIYQNGKWLMDSRVLAARQGYEHKVILQSIRRHKERLEAKSLLLHFEAKPLKGSRGGRPEQYYMLDERQCLILSGSLKKGKEADEWHDRLVDAFLQARDRVDELEREQSVPPKQEVPQHKLTDLLAERAKTNTDRVPEHFFSVMSILFLHLYNLERWVQDLDAKATIEISVGSRWSLYATEVLRIPSYDRKRYKHECANGLIVDAWAYSHKWQTHFEKWLWGIYFPEKFPEYAAYRANKVTSLTK